MKKKFLAALMLCLPFIVSASNCVYAPPLNLTVGTTAVNVLPLNKKRSYLFIENNGAGTAYLNPDSAPASGAGIPIPSGYAYEPLVVPINSLYMVSGSGTNAITIQEGNQ